MSRSVSRSTRSSPAWHKVFLRMLPAVRRIAEHGFVHLDPEAREECVQEVICNVCAAVARLADLDKLDLVYPSVLARFAIRQVKTGRKVGGHLNCADVLSPYCQRKKHITVISIDRFDEEENGWQEAVIQDTRSSPVPEIVSFRVDFAQWLKNLPRRDRRIAELLALGHRTSETAKRFKVTEGRVSQLRRELSQSWQAFVGEPPQPEAATAAA